MLEAVDGLDSVDIVDPPPLPRLPRDPPALDCWDTTADSGCRPSSQSTGQLMVALSV